MELYILQDKHKHLGQWKQWTTEILLCMQNALILYTNISIAHAYTVCQHGWNITKHKTHENTLNTL